MRVGISDPLFVPTDGYYQLSCFVGPGMAKAPNAQRTITTVNTPSIKPIPAFAKNILAVGSSGLKSVVDFYRDVNGADLAGKYTFDPTLGALGSYPIPNGAYYFKHSVASTETYGFAIFELAI